MFCLVFACLLVVLAKLIGNCGKPLGGKSGCRFGCLVWQEKGTMKHAHICLWGIISLSEATTSRCMNGRLNSIPMMRR